MTPIVGDLIESTAGKVVQGIVDKYLPKSMGEAEKADFALKTKLLIQDNFKMVAKDIQSARDMHAAALKDAPGWIKGYSACVTPTGGYAAIGVFFFNILAPYLGYVKVPLTTAETATINIILTFFFGYRLVQKVKGMAGKF